MPEYIQEWTVSLITKSGLLHPTDIITQTLLEKTKLVTENCCFHFPLRSIYNIHGHDTSFNP